jgi:geranylgeranylglycerol-phosphate geranylgeranyltransferase
MRTAHPVLRLARVDTSLLVSLSVFLPLVARTRDPATSLGRATPLLFIGMCTFIANDLDDIETDRVNHPDRPLPSGQINPLVATLLYFTCLGLALFTIRAWTPTKISFWYYALLILVISYGHIVEHFPSAKSLYVSAVSAVPIIIVSRFYPEELKLYFVVLAVFLFVLGRELCMDYLDRIGDKNSFLRRVRPRTIALSAFALQALGILLLTLLIDQPTELIASTLMTILLLLSARYWFKLKERRKSILLMKLQLFIGLYYLT